MFPAASSLFPFESLLDSFIIIGYAGILLSIFHIYRSHLTSNQSLTHDEIQNFKKMKYVIKVMLMVVILFFIILTVIDIMVFTFIPGTYYHLFSLIIIYSLLSYIDISVKMGRNYSYEGAIPKEEVKGARKIQFPKYYKFIWYGNAVALFLYCHIYVHMRGAPFYGIWAIIAWTGTVLSSYVPWYVIREFTILNEKQTRVLIINCMVLSWIMVYFWSSLGFR